MTTSATNAGTATATIDEALTRRVANLARLELTDEEVSTFTVQLKRVLQYIDQLQEIDVAPGGVPIEPLTYPVELETPLREDVARPFGRDSEGQSKVLACGPDVLDGGFKVPPII